MTGELLTLCFKNRDIQNPEDLVSKLLDARVDDVDHEITKSGHIFHWDEPTVALANAVEDLCEAHSENNECYDLAFYE